MVLPPLLPFFSESGATDARHVTSCCWCRFDQLAELNWSVRAKRGQTTGTRMTLTRHTQLALTANMNSLVSKFSTTDADSEIRRAKGIAEEDGLTDAMWGSQAGFGQLVHGHAFDIPAVPDVRSSGHLFSPTILSRRVMCLILARRVPEASHR